MAFHWSLFACYAQRDGRHAESTLKFKIAHNKFLFGASRFLVMDYCLQTVDLDWSSSFNHFVVVGVYIRFYPP